MSTRLVASLFLHNLGKSKINKNWFVEGRAKHHIVKFDIEMNNFEEMH